MCDYSLWISDINESSVLRDGKEELGILSYKIFYNQSSGIMLFESRPELVVNVYCKPNGKYSKILRSRIDML